VPEDEHAGKTIRWSNEAIVSLASLPASVRQSLFERIELVLQFPAMYPARQRGRFRGLRYFVVGRRWIVYYHVAENFVSVVTIVPARARRSDAEV
jgi:plasmid stabilization system protein ParE